MSPGLRSSSRAPPEGERGASGGDGIEFARLERYLKVLALANRLELLYALRKPRVLDEIHLTPHPSQAGLTPERPLTRQAVQHHLNQLTEAGLVRVRATERKGGRALQEYVLDHARLFAVVEELRKFSAIESLVPLDPFVTAGLAESRTPAWDEGPKLVLVHGVHEGRAFSLRHAELRPGRGWVIGRSPEAHVSLEYDPYVSTENAEILRVGNEFRLLDLRTAKNGTYLNWSRLPTGGEARLRTGDLIGLGRSLLLFREQ